MSKITLSEVVARSLLDACQDPSLERDEKGMFLSWDSLHIELNTGQITLMNAHTRLATLSLDQSFAEGTTLTIKGLEGRLRITFG